MLYNGLEKPRGSSYKSHKSNQHRLLSRILALKQYGKASLWRIINTLKYETHTLGK